MQKSECLYFSAWSKYRRHRHRRHHLDGCPLRVNQLIPLLDIANELDANLTRTTILTVLPGLICVGGVFFLHFGLVSAIMLYNIGLAASVSNALLPLIKHQRNKRSKSPLYLEGSPKAGKTLNETALNFSHA